MKRVINSENEIQTVKLDALPENNLIGIQTTQTQYSPAGKYVLSPIREDMVAFINGSNTWSRHASRKEALNSAFGDVRVTIFAFESLAELAAWISK